MLLSSRAEISDKAIYRCRAGVGCVYLHRCFLFCRWFHGCVYAFIKKNRIRDGWRHGANRTCRQNKNRCRPLVVGGTRWRHTLCFSLFILAAVVMMISKECDKSHGECEWLAPIKIKIETPNLMDLTDRHRRCRRCVYISFAFATKIKWISKFYLIFTLFTPYTHYHSQSNVHRTSIWPSLRFIYNSNTEISPKRRIEWIWKSTAVAAAVCLSKRWVQKRQSNSYWPRHECVCCAVLVCWLNRFEANRMGLVCNMFIVM